MKQIDPKQAHLFQEAKEKEWKSWIEYNTVDIVDEKEAREVLRDMPERVLRSRFV